MKKGRGTTVRPAAEFHTFWLRRELVYVCSMGHRSASDSCSTILVIDDDEDVRVAAQRVLRHHGFTVLVASDGGEGIELLQREAGIGIVLLDLNMPGLGGAETARELRRINPGISLILMSGEVEREVRERLQDIDFKGFVPKPFTITELLTVVRGLRGE